jgi:hypothetical protein
LNERDRERGRKRGREGKEEDVRSCSYAFSSVIFFLTDRDRASSATLPAAAAAAIYKTCEISFTTVKKEEKENGRGNLIYPLSFFPNLHWHPRPRPHTPTHIYSVKPVSAMSNGPSAKKAKEAWRADSWRSFPIKQQPQYPDQTILKDVIDDLRWAPEGQTDIQTDRQRERDRERGEERESVERPLSSNNRMISRFFSSLPFFTSKAKREIQRTTTDAPHLSKKKGARKHSQKRADRKDAQSVKLLNG